ncbi:MAG: ATP-binding protein [Allosphingosinicella sp.]|uniref:sensor histidine kinase n=1 Tax=Allosphingosinicella sp. TaxID=2823234 RepID=UPI00393875CA
MPKSDEQELSLKWSRRISLRHRILAVNIFAIAILAGSILYLDSFRSRLTQARVEQAATEVTMIARSLSQVPDHLHQPLLVRLGRDSGARLRIYNLDGEKQADSWEGAEPTYQLPDPAEEPWPRWFARALDNGFDAIVGAPQPPLLKLPEDDRLQAWPEAIEAHDRTGTTTALRRAPEGTAFVTAAAPIESDGRAVLLLSDNATEIRRVVRAERLTLVIILVATITVSVLLSRFLARTVAGPLRRLALAAHRVRLGRSREVDVPRLPERRDEIGLLARALHDMTQSLRQRIDATEAFAADVTHELKNPLASLRSAVDSLERTQDPALQAQLLDIVRQDVNRLDRLVVDIADTSRVDAELSRARFEPVDLGALIDVMLPGWEQRAQDGQRVAFARPHGGSAVVMGDESRLARLIDNLVDNALSFSPPDGLVTIRATRSKDEMLLSVEDEGPGVPEDRRQAIFSRFHSVRPDEDFGRHSGLGLAIAKAIAEGHGGSIEVGDRPDGRPGAWFQLRLPVGQS